MQDYQRQTAQKQRRRTVEESRQNPTTQPAVDHRHERPAGIRINNRAAMIGIGAVSGDRSFSQEFAGGVRNCVVLSILCTSFLIC